MSIIKASCTDQTLRLTNTPVIASGGVNENFITFEFCSQWDGYAKTAVFYNDRSVSYQVLDLQDTCVVPALALSEKGALHISVFGFNAEGVIRTSEVLRYEVVEGAVVSIPEPEASVYEQIMAQYAEAMAMLKDAAAITAVKYDVAQELTDDQKRTARENIAAGTGTVKTVDGATPDAAGVVSLNAVKFSEQELTSAQKAQVRANIGAGTGAGTVKKVDDATPDGSGAVKLDAVKFSAQTLTEEQQKQARTNLGISDAAAVLYGTEDPATYCATQGITPTAGTLYFKLTT